MPRFYTGMCFRFHGVRRFRMSDVTIVNPVTYGVQLSYVEDFSVENLNLLYYEGSPKLCQIQCLRKKKNLSTYYARFQKSYEKVLTKLIGQLAEES